MQALNPNQPKARRDSLVGIAKGRGYWTSWGAAISAELGQAIAALNAAGVGEAVVAVAEWVRIIGFVWRYGPTAIGIFKAIVTSIESD